MRSFAKSVIGLDLTKITMPVHFNEPLSFTQVGVLSSVVSLRTCMARGLDARGYVCALDYRFAVLLCRGSVRTWRMRRFCIQPIVNFLHSVGVRCDGRILL